MSTSSCRPPCREPASADAALVYGKSTASVLSLVSGRMTSMRFVALSMRFPLVPALSRRILPLRLAGGPGDPGQVQREGIHPDCMPVHPSSTTVA